MTSSLNISSLSYTGQLENWNRILYTTATFTILFIDAFVLDDVEGCFINPLLHIYTI
jgi:hypothetical protein